MLADLIDYDGLMQANLQRVFGEHDAARRIEAIHELYAEDAVLNEPHASFKGHVAINEAVTALLASLPPSFVFGALGPAIGHHGIGRLKWSSGPPDGPVAVTGMDIAHFENERIHSLFVFLDPAGA
ncbi:nuclear transport factor 2 family protein [Chitinolyticbacter albus]|uniref:nuclear transport factor 2 family protein n=1 Tax=Chitinolyticbacter albus TaxID=2961951 RepID=UPI0021097F8E|nr:nuclear transport factor 2 family protein [Chitinolyticbacter albus]